MAEQVWPDGSFPTVNFPNPEEKGALDLAIKVAKEHNAEFIIANDPDADRLAVAVPDAQGNWKPLHGNVVGCFLGWYLAKQYHSKGEKGVLACSLVSSPALAEIAKKYGFQSEETLTGFKYIGKVQGLLFGFEEALGYLVDPDKVRDKDGISAVMSLCEAAAYYKSKGMTLWDQMMKIYEKYGFYKEDQVSIVLEGADGAEKIKSMMTNMRNNLPEKIGKYKVIEFKDVELDEIKNLLTGEQRKTGLPKSNVLYYELENNAWCCVRPSGTEPKIKLYMGVKADSMESAEKDLEELKDAMVRLVK